MERQLSQLRLLSEDPKLELTTDQLVEEACLIITHASGENYVLGTYIHSILSLKIETPIRHPILLHHQDLYTRTIKEQTEIVRAIAKQGRTLDIVLRRDADIPVEHKKVSIIEAQKPH